MSIFSQLFITFSIFRTPFMAKSTLWIWLSMYLDQKVPKSPKLNLYFYPIIYCILRFLGQPLRWKSTLNKSILCILDKRHPKGPSSEGLFLWEGNYIDWKQISAFLDPYSLHFQFLGHPIQLEPWPLSSTQKANSCRT